jgi:hypothetical protein
VGKPGNIVSQSRFQMLGKPVDIVSATKLTLGKQNMLLNSLENIVCILKKKIGISEQSFQERKMLKHLRSIGIFKYLRHNVFHK